MTARRWVGFGGLLGLVTVAALRWSAPPPQFVIEAVAAAPVPGVGTVRLSLRWTEAAWADSITVETPALAEDGLVRSTLDPQFVVWELTQPAPAREGRHAITVTVCGWRGGLAHCAREATEVWIGVRFGDTATGRTL